MSSLVPFALEEINRKTEQRKRKICYCSLYWRTNCRYFLYVYISIQGNLT